MKQKLLFSLFVLLLATTTWASIKINEKNFPDENFRALLLESEFGEDSVLTAEEIASIDTLYLGHSGVKSLKGIEYFTSLIYLDCAVNNLTTLDVSKNTALRYLYCDLNKLTELDVLKNTALIELSCAYNQLTSLDVSKNTTLTELDCSYNQLTSLDLSKNIVLTELKCWINRLTSLNVSGCTALTFLDCGENTLPSLDVSGCAALKSLTCWNNRLESLDVSGCSSLTYLRFDKNAIWNEAMDALLESLPTVSSGTLRVFHTLAGEDNEMTTAQVAAAKAKGWTPYCIAGWREYEGRPGPGDSN